MGRLVYLYKTSFQTEYYPGVMLKIDGEVFLCNNFTIHKFDPNIDIIDPIPLGESHEFDSYCGFFLYFIKVYDHGFIQDGTFIQSYIQHLLQYATDRDGRLLDTKKYRFKKDKFTRLYLDLINYSKAIFIIGTNKTILLL